jgi:hypothetical protein
MPVINAIAHRYVKSKGLRSKNVGMFRDIQYKLAHELTTMVKNLPLFIGQFRSTIHLNPKWVDIVINYYEMSTEPSHYFNVG